ncbi:MAG: L-alanine-DL-glutamate epimerase [Ruminococcaceae bacterium]|nr:L-alanine-DL-glutamate epimerase [Oscillospiraceae bacterium]
MRKEITVVQAACAYEPELFKTAFGFKGNKLTGVWQVVVGLWDGTDVGIGLGIESVLWSDSAVFASYGEDKSNALMYQVTQHAARLVQGKTFTAPSELLDYVFDDCYRYAVEITGMEVTETFVLNALVPFDMAAWQLWARKTGSDRFDDIFAGTEHCEQLANIPLITYGVPVETVVQMAKEGTCLFKIKLGCDPDGDGDLQKMLLWDQKRVLQIHQALRSIPTSYTESGHILYYFDANGRYDTKERLAQLTDFLKAEGIAERTVLFEEPFAPENEVFVGDMGIPFAADESAHSLRDVKRRIELGYKALTLKPIAKTVTVTKRMAEAAYAANVDCFCADLTVNPLMVEWNKNFAARLKRLPGMKIGIVESNGAQNYVRWEQMKGYIPRAETQSDGSIYTLDEAFYRNAGGLYETPTHYLQLVCDQNPHFMR